MNSNIEGEHGELDEVPNEGTTLEMVQIPLQHLKHPKDCF